MYDTVQTIPTTPAYRLPMMRLLRDLILVPCAAPGKACETTEVMMARVQPTGMFELLSTAAWAKALGYAADELSGKSFSELMPAERPAAGELVAALLDKKGFQSLRVTLCCKDQRRKSFRLHRRFDPYQDAMYVVADEVSEDRAAPLRACG
jgi:PAS domain S-box-containing protein